MEIKDFNIKPFYKLDKEWALLTVGNEEKFNTMTISWGGFGTLWNKPVVTVYVKPIRYTYELLNNNEYFTISFYSEEFKKDLGILGSKTGRDTNKINDTKLTPLFLDNITTFNEANITIVCKKIYLQALDINNITDDSLKAEVEAFNNGAPMNEMFIGEVIDIIEKDK